VVASIGWIDPRNGNFKLTDSSPAVNRGMMDELGVWEYFEKRYGLSIRTDVYGTPRPIGSAADVGATEKPATATP
jgi:hypothetical protein